LLPARLAILVSILGFTAAGLLWVERPQRTQADAVQPTQSEPSAAKSPLRLGLVPERDIFAQRRRYRALADYLSQRIDQPVELVTLGSYEQILTDFAEHRVDAAFLGSFVTVLAVDRLGAQVLVKPTTADGKSTYQGVIFVRDDSPARSLADLAGKTIVMVRATSAGSLFPLCQLRHAGLLDGPSAVKITWVGTHDDAVQEVIDGTTDAGAAKDSRLEQIQIEQPAIRLRRLAISDAVPENALVVRHDLASTWGPRLSDVLSQMSNNDEGRAALRHFGADRFVALNIDEYRPVYEMCGDVNDRCWTLQGISGAPPRWPVKEQR
jgi:phosphonate transport system substrate-binding protein